MGYWNIGNYQNNATSGAWSAPYQYQPMSNMMYGYGYGPGWGYMGGWSWILSTFFWILLIVGIVVLVRWAVRGMHHERHKGGAIEILKERYAKGDIDKKEFEEKKKDLSS